MEFFRQEYWSALPFPSPGALPDLGIEPASRTLAGRFFITELPGNPLIDNTVKVKVKSLNRVRLFATCGL